MRLQNHALAEENLRLTDLTRMLLSSPHFSDVLNDLSVNGVPAQLQGHQTTPSQSHPQSVVSQTPIPSSAAGPQQNMQGNMVMVQDNRMDIYSTGWNSGIDMNYTNANVFAVLEVPEGPAIDSEILSGKSSNFVETSSDSSKIEVPQLERPPVITSSAIESTKKVADSSYELDETDPSFALFLDDVSPSSATMSRISFDGVQTEKACVYQLVVEQDSEDISVASVRRFERLCSSMDAAFERVCRATDYLM